MSDKSAERVLGLPTERLRMAGIFQGFRPFDSDMFRFLLQPEFLEYRPRGQAETDPEFKQLIPYLVLRCGDQFFHYTRGQGGAEVRLRAKRSIGIGGHISADEDSSQVDPYRAGMLRELAEEIDIQTFFRERPFGLINDDATPVGEVHLGVVHLLDLNEPRVTPREAGIANSGFAPLRELLMHAEEFESWSRLVMEAML
jgi:predicted NUDIX family phosphoesterase